MGDISFFTFIIHPKTGPKMGLFNKKKKSGGASKAAPPPQGPQLQEFKGLTMEKILNDDMKNKRFRAYLKQNDPDKMNHFQFLQAERKRRNIYQSSLKCGDSKEEAIEHLVKHADMIFDQFIKANGSDSLKEINDENRNKYLNGDKEEIHLFEDLKKQLEKEFEEKL